MYMEKRPEQQTHLTPGATDGGVGGGLLMGIFKSFYLEP